MILTDQALLAADIVARGAGIAVSLHNESALADALGQLERDDALTERMSRNAFNHTADLGHRAEDWIDALLAAYRASLSAESLVDIGQ